MARKPGGERKTNGVSNGQTRRIAGAIITVRNEDRSRVRTYHETGSAGEATAEILKKVDALDGVWYVDAISTLDSVYRDVHFGGQPRYTTERAVLGRLGRLDLLRSPREYATTDSTKKQGHAWRGKFIFDRKPK